jgi:glycosyltransferase involved in cell wall biosynthesis
VLWLIDSLTVGGAERLAAVFARRHDRARLDLRVACLKEIDGNPLAREIEAAGVPLTVLHARNLRDAGAFRRLVRLIREQEIDLIHAHLTYADVWGRLAGRVTRRPVVSTVHVQGYTNPNDPSRRDGVVESLARFVRKNVGGPVVAVSDALRRRLVEAGLPPARVVTVRNGIELENFDLPADFSRAARRAEFGIPADAAVAVTLAVVREGKGHDLLLDAAREVLKRLPGAHFLLVGGGPLEAALRRRIEEEGLAANVHMTGMRADAAEMLALGDVFVLPSSQFDALPTVVMEAMASRLPVVAVASGGASELIVEGETGLVVPSPEAGALACAVAELFENPERARIMGERGRERAESEFSARAWADRLVHLYEGVAGGVTEAEGRAVGNESAEEAGRRRLRVSVVEFLGRGGMVHYAYQLCRALAEEGARVELLTDHDYELETLPHNFAVRRVFKLWNPRPEGGVVWSSSLRARVVRLARRSKRAAMYYRDWWRLVRLVRRERPDVVQFGEIRFATDLLPLLALRASGARLADVCHNVAPFDVSADSSKITKESRVYRAVFRRIYACFDAVFVHSEVNRREFVRLYGGPPERIHVIPHGNEGMFVAPGGGEGKGDGLAGELGLKAGAPTALFFGTLTKYKGLEYLLDAFAEVRRRLPEAQLVVAGFPNPDVDVEALRARAEQSGISGAVKFYLRYVPLEDVPGLFAASDVVVFPYLMIYQSGALQVAYSFGKPVVATDVGGLSEAVSDGETGLLVPPRDAGALAAALAELLGDPERARRMGERGRELSETEYSWGRIARSVQRVYAGITGRAPREALPADRM